LELGPVTTFQPDTPTVYLAVGGEPDQLDALGRLREVVFVEPLARDLTWPFVPHITIADDMSPSRIDAAVAALSDYRVMVRFDAVHLLEEQPGPDRRWLPIADYHLRPAITVGRGSLPLELVVSDGPAPDVRALLDGEDRHGTDFETAYPPPAGDWRSLVVTARRRGSLVGVVGGFTDGTRSSTAVLVVDRHHRGEGIARHLQARFVAEGGPDVDAL
jgi:hypothetical protein